MDGNAERGRDGDFEVFTRIEWAALRGSTPLALTASEVEAISGAGEEVSLREVEEVLLPLSRLMNLYVVAARRLAEAEGDVLGRPARVPPYVVAVAGSVAVGKSTFARLLRAVLARWPDHPQVRIVTTDGFLHPNRVLEERGLMERKGFPESYDLRNMIAFLRAVKAGEPEVRAPVYSHVAYDIQPGEVEVIRRPDILIFEGLNVLQTPAKASVTASDFFDISIYLDAPEAEIERWFVERVLRFRETAFRDPGSYFQHVSRLARDDATEMARGVWRDINRPNLRENIAPTRARARLVLTKGPDHAIREVALRRI
jgi:type I pantothenate kinase